MNSYKDILSKISDLEEVRDFRTNERTISDDELLEYTVDLLQARMNHCSSELFANFKNAKSIYQGQTIVWEGGHFGLPTYLAMEEFVKHPTLEGIDFLIAEQAWKQLTYSFNGSIVLQSELVNIYAEFMAHSMWEQIQEAWRMVDEN